MMVARETIVFKLSAHNRLSKDIDWVWEGKIIFFQTGEKLEGLAEGSLFPRWKKAVIVLFFFV